MIKLENNAALPQARSLLVIESRGDQPAISLATEEVREEINGNWTTSQANVRQVLTCFIDGKPFKLTAKLAAAYAVECSACAKVTVEVEAKLALSSTYEKGDKSKEVCQLTLIRVVEVWATAAKKLWSAADLQNGSAKPAVTVDLANGNGIGKHQLAGGRA